MKHKLFVLFIIFSLIPIIAFAADWVPMSSGTTNRLNSIWGNFASDIFAVGSGGTILHYDGNNWSSVASSTTYDLNDVWGSSGSDVFAVGVNGTILHYDGANWDYMNSGTTNALNGIWGSSSSDVFAVGSGGTILHYNGKVWSPMNSGTTIGFLDVWGSSGADVYVTGIGDRTYCLNHYDGNTWQCSYLDFNAGIWGSSATDIFTGAYSIWHYDGSGWTWLRSFFGCFDIWGSSANDVFFVGFAGKIEHYNGISFTPMSSGTTSNINGVWGSSGSDVFAVGDYGTILHYGETSTLIGLSSFTATPSNKEVIIEWSTEAETDNAGFNLYCATTENGEYIKINDSLIPAKGSFTQGASYEFVDKDVKNRKTYYYKLEDVDLNGQSTMHGPVTATPRWIFRILKK